MAEKRHSKASTMAAYGVIGLLVVALAGFGTQNFGGAVDTVATIGARELSVQRYVEALRNQQRRFQDLTGQQVSFAALRQSGIERAVLGALIGVGAMEDEASRLGLSMSDERLREIILNLPQFQRFGGLVDKKTYRNTIRNMGTNIEHFEDDVRLQVAATLLERALAEIATPSPTYIDALVTYLSEQRNFEWAELSPNQLSTPLLEPDGDALRAYYEANLKDFILPETRHITYIALTPDMLMSTFEIDETALRALYNKRSKHYNWPEHRLVDRLVFTDTQSAEAAAKALASGRMDFDTLRDDRGLLSQDVDLGEVSMLALGSAGEGVFALDQPGITGVLSTDLGPTIFRINAILEPISVSFDEVRDVLRDELGTTRAVREILEQMESIDDLLASGASLEEIAQESTLRLDQLALTSIPREGFSADGVFLDAAFGAKVGDFPELIQRADGGIFALRLDRLAPPRQQLQNEVETELRASWSYQAEKQALLLKADEMVSALKSGQDFAAFGLTPVTQKARARMDALDEIPGAVLAKAFRLTKGQAAHTEQDNKIYVLRVSEIIHPGPGSQEITAYRSAIKQKIYQTLQTDILNAYKSALTSNRKIDINENVLTAIITQN